MSTVALCRICKNLPAQRHALCGSCLHAIEAHRADPLDDHAVLAVECLHPLGCGLHPVPYTPLAVVRGRSASVGVLDLEQEEARWATQLEALDVEEEKTRTEIALRQQRLEKIAVLRRKFRYLLGQIPTPDGVLPTAHPAARSQARGHRAQWVATRTKVLDALAECPNGIRPGELAALIDVPKSTVQGNLMRAVKSGEATYDAATHQYAARKEA